MEEMNESKGKEVSDMQIEQKYKAISDPTRRKILDLLKEGSMTAGDIADSCQTTKPNISQHLKMLKESKLICDEKKGMYVHYSLNKQDFNQTKSEVRGLLSIKDKILNDVKKIAYEKKCEPVVGATDSQDDGTFSIMKGTTTILSFYYSFHLSSFVVEFEIPSRIEAWRIFYQDTEKMEEFLSYIKEIIYEYLREQSKRSEQKDSLRQQIVNELNHDYRYHQLFLTKNELLMKELKDKAEDIILHSGVDMSVHEKSQLLHEIVLEVTSLGKIHGLLEDPSVSEVMINDCEEVWVEKNGKVTLTDIKFKNQDELMSLARKIARVVGKRIDNGHPILNARFPDGSCIHIIIPPVSMKGVTITIRKSFQEKLEVEDLVKYETISKDGLKFLEMAVKSRANIIVSGGTGAGKTTVLNALSYFVPEDERMVVIEDIKELQVTNENVVRLESRLPNAEGLGGISMRDLIKTTHFMRAERMVVGEIRDGSAYDYLQMSNMGHDGGMTSTNSLSPEGCLTRFETLIAHAGFDFSNSLIKKLLVDGVDLIVQIERLKDGSRKITNISEVLGYNEHTDKIDLQPIFIWETQEIKDGKILGKHMYTGAQLSNELKYKFDKNGYGNTLHFDDSITKEKKKKEQIEKQLTSILFFMADVLKSGRTISESLRIMGEESMEPFAFEFRKAYQEMQSGKTLKESLQNMKKRISHFDFDMVANSLIIQDYVGGNTETALRKVITIIEERNRIRRLIPLYKKEEMISSPFWEFMEYIDLLSVVTLNNGNLEENILLVSEELKGNVSKEFNQAVEEIKNGKSRNNALRDLALRFDTPEFNEVIFHMRQAEVFGVNVSTVLETHSRKFRETLTEFCQINFKK